MLARQMHRTASRQSGVTLIELMTSMVIGLLVLAAVSYVFLGSRQTYRYNDELARLQENSRIAIDMLTRNIRMAGYLGCGKPGVMTISGAGVGGLPDFTTDNALRGNPAGFVEASAVAGNDTIRIQKVAESAASLDTGFSMVTTTDPIRLSTLPVIAAGDVAVVSNCENADIFTVDTVDATTFDVTPTAALSQTYNHGIAGAYEEDVYFIQDTGRTNAAGTKINALSVLRQDGSIDEMIESVDRMVIQYGVDTDFNGTIDSYVAAAAVADWSSVMAVRVDLLLSSVTQNVTTEKQKFSFMGEPAFDDNRLRSTAGVTIALRNRLK